MSIATAIKFDTRPEEATVGKISFVSTNDVAILTTVEAYVTVTDPLGTVIQAETNPAGPGNYTIPIGGSNAAFLVDIPLDSNGAYLGGTYSINIRFRNTGSLIFNLPPVTLDYEFCAHNTPDSLLNSHVVTGETISCVTGDLVARDSTDYATNVFTLVSRLITIDPPPIDGRADVTSATVTAEITVTYTNVVYPVLYAIQYSYNPFTDSFTGPGTEKTVTVETLAGAIIQSDVNITCKNNSCATLACLQSYFEGLYNQACAAGGWSRLTASASGNFNLAMTYTNLAAMQLACGNVAKYSELLNLAKDLIDDCGCGCTDCTETPQPFIPAT